MIFTNFNLEVDGKLEFSNGATRRKLVVVNLTGKEITENTPFEAKIGTLNKGNHSFVFLNKGSSDKDLWVLMSSRYGAIYHNADDKIVFKAESIGGYGNSESNLAVLEGGVMIELPSYKDRSESSWLKTTDKGFEHMSNDQAMIELYCDEIEYI